MNELDRYLPERVRDFLEQEFYARVNEQSLFDRLIFDRVFWEDATNHVGLFNDHGVVHVRDVSRQILDVINTINGILIPERDYAQLDFFMRGYGVIISYLHDVGMSDISKFGRAVHPEFASQLVFSSAFDGLFEILWEENCGNIAWRVTNLASKGLLTQPPEVVMREILAMSNCHSKSKIPVTVLNDPVKMRDKMIHVLTTNLQILYLEFQVDKAEKEHRRQPSETTLRLLHEAESALKNCPFNSDEIRQHVQRFYNNCDEEAYAWLINPHPDIQALRDDVIDTLRALRCADALRQRGTVLKTSGNYEIFIDQVSANAIYALRRGMNSSTCSNYRG